VTWFSSYSFNVHQFGAWRYGRILRNATRHARATGRRAHLAVRAFAATRRIILLWRHWFKPHTLLRIKTTRLLNARCDIQHLSAVSAQKLPAPPVLPTTTSSGSLACRRSCRFGGQLGARRPAGQTWTSLVSHLVRRAADACTLSTSCALRTHALTALPLASAYIRDVLTPDIAGRTLSHRTSHAYHLCRPRHGVLLARVSRISRTKRDSLPCSST